MIYILHRLQAGSIQVRRNKAAGALATENCAAASIFACFQGVPVLREVER